MYDTSSRSLSTLYSLSYIGKRLKWETLYWESVWHNYHLSPIGIAAGEYLPKVYNKRCIFVIFVKKYLTFGSGRARL